MLLGKILGVIESLVSFDSEFKPSPSYEYFSVLVGQNLICNLSLRNDYGTWYWDLLLFIYPVDNSTVGAESLCRCRWKVRYLRPLDLKSQMTLKCFHYEFGRWICRPLSWYNVNCLDFVIILLPIPKVNNWREMLFNGLRWVWSEK